MGPATQNFRIFTIFEFAKVFFHPKLEQENPIMPEVIISANDIGIPATEAITNNIPPVV